MKSNGLSYLLVPLLAVMPLEGQSQPAPHQDPADSLNIVVVEGEGVIHNLPRPVASQLIVRVEDENKKPVAGATVAFALPAQGASGTFTNEAAEATAMTDASGVAVVRGQRPNQVAGKLEIRVVASYKGQTARATVMQFNMLVQNPARKSATGKVILILSLVGAAAAGGAYAGLHKNSPAAAAPTAAAPTLIGITPGTGTVGAPH